LRVTDASSKYTQVEGAVARHRSGQRPSLTQRASHRAAVPKLFGTKDQFPGRQFFHGTGRGNGFRMIQWFQDDSSSLCLLCTLFLLLLHQLHLRSSGIRSWLGGGGVGDPCQRKERWLACRGQEAGSRGRPCLTVVHCVSLGPDS